MIYQSHGSYGYRQNIRVCTMPPRFVETISRSIPILQANFSWNRILAILLVALLGWWISVALEKGGVGDLQLSGIIRWVTNWITWNIKFPMGSMGLVYLPTWMALIYGKCRKTFHKLHGAYLWVWYPHTNCRWYIFTTKKPTFYH